MMEVIPFQFGSAKGSINDFPEIGDRLPMHVHDETNNHISIVAKGSFRAHGDDWELTLVSGKVIDWPAGQAHEFIALEAGSRLVNISKGNQ